MPKQDLSKLAGIGSKIQTELTYRFDELRSLKIIIKQYKDQFIPEGLEKVDQDLKLVKTNPTMLAHSKRKFIELSTNLEKQIVKPFAKLTNNTNKTITKDYNKFKQNIINVPAEYNFQATIVAIEQILSDFNQLKAELYPIIENLKAQLTEFEHKFIKLETDLQLLKMERSVEKLSKDVVKLAQKKANVEEVEPLNLSNLLERLQDIQDAGAVLNASATKPGFS